MELVPLDGRAHQTTTFSCGEEPLDRWLREAAAPRRRATTRTFVVSDLKRVLAYYSLEAFSIELAALPSHEATRVCTPAIRWAALAVDSREQGRDVGSALLLDALVTCVRVADVTGARLVTVSVAHDRVTQFFRECGFRLLSADPRMLYLPMQDVRLTVSGC